MNIRTSSRSRTALGRWFDGLAHDVRFALRSFRVNPIFAVTAVATLALGIAATTTVMSVVDATLLRPLPFTQPDRIVKISAFEQRRPQYSFGVQQAVSSALRNAASLESVAEYASYVSQPYTVPRSDGPQVINGVNVSREFFRVFRVSPALGRAFTAEDENVEQPAVCVLTATGLRRLFPGQQNVVGRTLTFVEGQVTVIGVMDEGYWHPMVPQTKFGQGEANPDLLVPIARRGRLGGPDSYHEVAARLQPGATIAQASREAEALARENGTPNDDGTKDGVRMHFLQDKLALEAKPTLLVLFGFAVCLLLICSVNIANLLLSNSNSRARELALRTTLGAGRLRLFRQLLTEHLVLAMLGGLTGLYLTVMLMDTFVALLPAGLLIVPRIDLDTRMLAITGLVTIVAGALAGLGPALVVATRRNLGAALRSGGQTLAGTARSRRFASLLMVVEAAVLLVLLSGGGLLVNTLVRLKTINLGFDPDRLWTAEFYAQDTLYPDKGQVARLADRAAGALRALPGVASVGESDWGLLGGFCPENTMMIPGRPGVLRPQTRHVSADYFAAVNMPLQSGRFWTTREENVKPEVAIINEAAARAYWPGVNPVGQRIALNEKWPVEIVGVVRDLREANEREAPGPSIYLPLNPFSTRFYRARTILIRTAQPRAGLGQEAIKAMAAIDPRLPVEVTRSDHRLSDRRQDPRFYAVIVGMAAAFGLLLAAVGIGGVTAQSVARRTREIGVRLTLGAEISSVVNMVVRQVCAPVVVGVVLGVGGALALSRVMKSFLYEISPHDPVTHVVAVVLLAGVALAAAYLPARRAARIDPVDALRAE